MKKIRALGFVILIAIVLCACGEERELAEEMKECLEDFSSAQEKRAYVQGYADCVQALYQMGILKENEGLQWAEKIDVR